MITIIIHAMVQLTANVASTRMSSAGRVRDPHKCMSCEDKTRVVNNFECSYSFYVGLGRVCPPSLFISYMYYIASSSDKGLRYIILALLIPKLVYR